MFETFSSKSNHLTWWVVCTSIKHNIKHTVSRCRTYKFPTLGDKFFRYRSQKRNSPIPGGNFQAWALAAAKDESDEARKTIPRLKGRCIGQILVEKTSIVRCLVYEGIVFCLHIIYIFAWSEVTVVVEALLLLHNHRLSISTQDSACMTDVTSHDRKSLKAV